MMEAWYWTMVSSWFGGGGGGHYPSSVPKTFGSPGLHTSIESVHMFCSRKMCKVPLMDLSVHVASTPSQQPWGRAVLRATIVVLLSLADSVVVMSHSAPMVSALRVPSITFPHLFAEPQRPAARR